MAHGETRADKGKGKSRYRWSVLPDVVSHLVSDFLHQSEPRDAPQFRLAGILGLEWIYNALMVGHQLMSLSSVCREWRNILQTHDVWNAACSPFVYTENLPAGRDYFLLCMRRHCLLCLLHGQAAVRCRSPEARRTITLATLGNKSVCARHTRGTYCGSCFVSSVYGHWETDPSQYDLQFRCEQAHPEDERANTLRLVAGDELWKFGLNDRDGVLFSNVEAVCMQCRQAFISSTTHPRIKTACTLYPPYRTSLRMVEVDETRSILDTWSGLWESMWMTVKYQEMRERQPTVVPDENQELTILLHTYSRLIFSGYWLHPHDIVKPNSDPLPLFMMDQSKLRDYPVNIIPPLTWATYSNQLPAAYYCEMHRIFSPLFQVLCFHRHISLEKALQTLRAQKTWYLTQGRRQEASFIPHIPSLALEPSSLTYQTLNSIWADSNFCSCGPCARARSFELLRRRLTAVATGLVAHESDTDYEDGESVYDEDSSTVGCEDEVMNDAGKEDDPPKKSSKRCRDDDSGEQDPDLAPRHSKRRKLAHM